MRSRSRNSLCLAAALWIAAAGADAAKPRRRSHRSVPKIAAQTILPGKPSEWDRSIAQAAERALAGRAGTVMAMDPRTGRVLFVVNPNYGLWHAYQPCSVFKVVVALAGLSEGVITPQMRLPCTRGCWKPGGHGPIDLKQALAVSCNTYFEQVGELLGYDTLQKYARQLALGELTGINLTGEVPGTLPAACPPDLVGRLSSYADGITTTAVQIGVMLSAVVNGGIVFQPQIAGSPEFVPKERWRLPPGTVLDGLTEGFLGAVNEGTAVSAFDPDVAVAGKTGSCLHSGWFASYAPAGGPELVLVVHLRNGNGHRAAAVAGRVYQAAYKAAPSASAPAMGGAR